MQRDNTNRTSRIALAAVQENIFDQELFFGQVSTQILSWEWETDAATKKLLHGIYGNELPKSGKDCSGQANALSQQKVPAHMFCLESRHQVDAWSIWYKSTLQQRDVETQVEDSDKIKPYTFEGPENTVKYYPRSKC